MNVTKSMRIKNIVLGKLNNKSVLFSIFICYDSKFYEFALQTCTDCNIIYADAKTFC